MRPAVLLAVVLGGSASVGCSLSASFLGKSPASAGEPQSRRSRSPSTPSSGPDQAVAATSTTGDRATEPAAGSARLVAYLDHGATSYANGRLHFDAYLVGLPASSTPPSVELRGEDGTLGAVAMRPDRSWDDVFVCQGTTADALRGTVRYYDDCSIAADLRAGSYELAIVVDGRAVAEQAIAIASTHNAGGQPSLIVAPSARAGRGTLSYANTTFWHQIDARDQIEPLQFVWMRGDQVIGKGRGLAHGRPLWHEDTPLVDVVPVRGPEPSLEWGTSADGIRLLVFANAEELVARLRLEVVYTTGSFGKVGALVPADDVTDAQLGAAREVAIELGGGRGVQYIDIDWPETVVCAVARSPDARAALKEWVQAASGVGHSQHDARTADQRSKQEWRTRAERKKHAQSAENSRQGARAGARRARDADGALRRLAREHEPGCLTALAPVTEA